MKDYPPLSHILRRGQHTLGQAWASQLPPQSVDDLEVANTRPPRPQGSF